MTATPPAPGPPASPAAGPPASPAVGPTAAGPTAAGPTPLDLATGELDGLDELPVHAHVERFEAVHAALTDLLSGIDGI